MRLGGVKPDTRSIYAEGEISYEISEKPKSTFWKEEGVIVPTITQTPEDFQFYCSEILHFDSPH